MVTLGDTLREASAALKPVSDSARLDAELLIAFALNIPRLQLITRPEQALDATQQAQVQALLQRRLHGEPVAYILGRRDFWDMQLAVTPATLIPRPETELLVETALELFAADSPITAIDLGTGSGAIAIALARARPAWHVTATDLSSAALEVARTNAQHYALGNIQFFAGNWFLAVHDAQRFDLIVSNPPYVAEHDPHLHEGDVRYEPQQALRAGHDGLDAIRALIHESRQHLREHGWLLLEHGYDQAEVVNQLLRDYGYKQIKQKRDLAGQPRMSCGQYIPE